MNLSKALRVAEKAKDDPIYRRENREKVRKAEDRKFELVKELYPEVIRIGYGR